MCTSIVNSRRRLLLAVLVAANILVAGYLLARRSGTAKAIGPLPLALTQSLPLIELKDDAGQAMQTSTLLGSPLFVQFVNPYVEPQIASFLRVRGQNLRRPISWVIITRDSREFRRRMPKDAGDLIVVEDNYERLSDLFNIPKCCEEWRLFDETGRLRGWAKYDEGDAVGSLLHLVNGDAPFSRDMLLATIIKISDDGLLEQLHSRAARSKRGKAVGVIFSQACTGCPEHYLIDLLRARASNDQGIAYLALLPNSFQASDADNFKTNLDISFDVERANPELSRRWSILDQTYGTRLINGTVIAVSQGKVVSIETELSETREMLRRFAQ
ncbi:MAG: hypothetical protein DMF61_06865 [Blastocatellia bacterium AA13]|nr:MAG: hypothetical protein DMF61_06865 [Blastocatellia bacterium AA13]